MLSYFFDDAQMGLSILPSGNRQLPDCEFVWFVENHQSAFHVVAHGTADEVANAKKIIEGTKKAIETEVHRTESVKVTMSSSSQRTLV